MAHLSTKWITVSEPLPHVLLLELNRKPVNAFCIEFWRMYGKTFERIPVEVPDIRAVVVASALPKLFTAGLDLNDAENLGNTESDIARNVFRLKAFIKEFQSAIGAPERFPFPVIAAVHGITMGLGVDIVCACDIRYAASDATFSIKEADIGLAADIGSLAYLPKIAGNQSLVRELAYTTEAFSAQAAEQMGLVSKVVEGGKEGVVTSALEVARKIAEKSPVAIHGTKCILTHSRDHTVSENLDYVSLWNGAALHTNDMAEALSAKKKKGRAVFIALRKEPAKM